MEGDELQIKQEPLDSIEFPERLWREPRRYGSLDLKDQKEESEGSAEYNVTSRASSPLLPLPTNNILEIVNEGLDMITVNAGDMKSEDENYFISHLPDELAPQMEHLAENEQRTCNYCMFRFATVAVYTAHLTKGLCRNEKAHFKCSMCDMRFRMRKDVVEHTNVHVKNMFFCNQFCGNSFETLEECEEHQYRVHQHESKRCNICSHKFVSYQSLEQHKCTMHRNLERFVCSLCHEWFISVEELGLHWKSLPESCGLIICHASKYSKIKPNTKSKSPRYKLKNLNSGDLVPLDDDLTAFDELPVKRFILRKYGNTSLDAPESFLKANNIVIKEETLDHNDLNSHTLTNGFWPDSNVDSLPNINTLDALIKTEPKENEVNAGITIKSEPFEMQDVAQMIPITANTALSSLPSNFNIIQIPVHTPPRITTETPITTPSRAPLQPPVLSIKRKVVKLESGAKDIPMHGKAPTKVTATVTSSQISEMSVQAPMATTAKALLNSTLNSVAAQTDKISLHELSANAALGDAAMQILLAEAANKAEAQKFYLSKGVLSLIENLPEKRELIDNMRKQITGSFAKTTATENIAAPKARKDSSEGSIHSPVLSENLKPPAVAASAVVEEPSQFRDCHVLWTSPRCSHTFETKSAFLKHLVDMHGLAESEFHKWEAIVIVFKSGDSTSAAVAENPMPTIAEVLAPTMQHAKVSKDASTSPNASKKNSSNVKKSDKKETSVEGRMFSCYKCGRKCSSRTMLSDHVRGNCSREPLYTCPQCSKRFFSSGTLNCHMSIHTGVLPHKCDYCDKRFRTRGQVTVHHRTHTGEKPFVCQICSQKFTHRETLISHLSRHIGMKRYKCYGCNKHFSCISGLRMHRDIRPDTCGKVKFNSRAIGPRVRVVKGQVSFEPQPEVNPYLRTDDPQEILSEIQNQPDKK